MTDAATDDDNLGTMPRYVIFRGKKARVLSYEGKTETRRARFNILDSNDQRRTVTRDQIAFPKTK